MEVRAQLLHGLRLPLLGAASSRHRDSGNTLPAVRFRETRCCDSVQPQK
jgi:hypothetical protein